MGEDFRVGTDMEQPTKRPPVMDSGRALVEEQTDTTMDMATERESLGSLHSKTSKEHNGTLKII